ncbi:hypothetical protein [Chitinophaga qingshengii]|uniref:DUF4919 domain-containing protein n=1 Tax=Chitinophaga qingshengii TaxID=1569794 RepID=A0ABR7TYT1_9BACT|nr:hypothetical protein [Chitinophaga qingshengii]MBC9934724.1 hypothetical protein [Chitinophaga qingshengii]
MKYLMFVAAILGCLRLSAQEEPPEWKNPSKSSLAYAEYRRKLTVPPYGLAKVKALIDKIPYKEDDSSPMENKDYLPLSLREKFTYHMIHAEISAQNCDVRPPIQDEDKKIFGQMADGMEESVWSDRQSKFLISNRDSVMALIKESVNRSKRMGANYKMAIVEINGREMIPFIIETYNKDQKDRDLLTLLMLLMKNNEYNPFMVSQSYRKLYGDNADYQSYIDYNKGNEDLIIKRATDYYNTIRK